MKSIEGFYEGYRSVPSIYGRRVIFMIETKEGRFGIWAPLDLQRKTKRLKRGDYIRITGPDYMSYDPRTFHKTGKTEEFVVFKIEIDPTMRRRVK